MSSTNPYAAPTDNDEAVIRSDGLGRARTLSGVFWTWVAICVISAAPSFLFGLAFGTTTAHISAMLTGVFLFVLAFTYADYYVVYPRTKGNRRLRLTLVIGYGTRIAISVAFPIAIMIDVFLGAISSGLVHSIPVFEAVLETSRTSEPVVSPLIAFLAILITTIIQGLLLNVVLLGYMAVVWCFLAITGIGTKEPRPRKSKRRASWTSKLSTR